MLSMETSHTDLGLASYVLVAKLAGLFLFIITADIFAAVVTRE